MRLHRVYPFVSLFLSATPLWAGDLLKREAQVPPSLAFVRTVDLEILGSEQNKQLFGAQTYRLRTRYLDPDVNAFVGLVTGVIHHNQDMRLGDPTAPSTAGTMWNWGANIGIRRGRQLWELDLMGSLFSDRLGFAPAVVGEHGFGRHWGLFHRTEANIFVGDMIVDADQGMYFEIRSFRVSAGYRIFASQHMSRSGPRLGLSYFFSHPKLPFLFPSLG